MTLDFSKFEAAEFAAAVTAGDEATMAKMLWQKRRLAEIGPTKLTAAVDGALCPDGAPSLAAR